MAYDKQKEESFKEMKNTLNDVNENYKDVFKALIVKSADYKENGKKIEIEMEEFSKKCDTTLYLKKNKKGFNDLYKLFLEIAKNVPKKDEDAKQEIKEGKGCCNCSIFYKLNNIIILLLNLAKKIKQFPYLINKVK